MNTAAPPLRVMTFNVRCEQPSDAHRWDDRKGLLVDVVRAYGPDLLGTQEVVARQGDDLRAALPDYGFVGVGRDDGKRGGEFSAILFKLDRFGLHDGGTFWLSETPEVAGSKGWDGDCVRIATWARLADKTNGRELVIVNTHFDHRGERARSEAARLIRARLDGLAKGAATIVCGDFNCTEDDAPYATMTAGGALRDTYRLAHPTARPDEASFHGFEPAKTAGKRIDWILTSPAWQTRGAAIDRTTRDGAPPSDHFPVTAEIAWPS